MEPNNEECQENYKKIKGMFSSHEFRCTSYSPTCDCGTCSCFGDHTPVVYGYKQTTKIFSFVCEEHLDEYKLNYDTNNNYFLEHENNDRIQKQLYPLRSLNKIKPTKIVPTKPFCLANCGYPECQNKKNLSEVYFYQNECICENCASKNQITEKYYKHQSGFSGGSYICPECTTCYEIKYEKNESDHYLCASCTNPYEIIGTCDENNNFYPMFENTEIFDESEFDTKNAQPFSLCDHPILKNIITDFKPI
jgi:hypothetical protein